MLDKGWLVTRLMSRGVWSDFQAFPARAPIAARNHAHRQSLRLQVLDQRHDQWGFSAATDHHVADHNDSNREAFRR